MKIGDEINYNGHKPHGHDHGDTTIIDRIEAGTVTTITPEGWIEVTLESGMRVCMSEERMKIACELEDDHQ